MTELYSPMLASLPLLLWKTPPGLELILAQEGVPFETVKDASSALVPRRAGSSCSTAARSRPARSQPC